MRDDVALREGATLRPKLRAELGEEIDIEVHLLVVGAIERAHRGRGRPTRGRCCAAEQHRLRREILRAERRAPVALDAIHVPDDPAVVAAVRVRARLTLARARSALPS